MKHIIQRRNERLGKNTKSRLYKVNMFALLGKPGFEEKRKELEKRLK